MRLYKECDAKIVAVIIKPPFEEFQHNDIF